MARNRIELTVSDGLKAQIDEIADREYRRATDLVKEAARLYVSGEIGAAAILRTVVRQLELDKAAAEHQIGNLTIKCNQIAAICQEQVDEIKELNNRLNESLRDREQMLVLLQEKTN